MSDKPRTYIGLVIDESGSMGSVRDETIAGLNDFVAEQQKSDNPIFLSLTKFSSDVSVVFQAKPVADVDKITTATYQPGGSTALNDAIAKTIVALETQLDRDKEAGILIVIMTDGYENNSVEFGGPAGHENIKALIKKKESEGNWSFVFLGADIDAFAVGGSYGIGAGNIQGYGKAGTKQEFKNLASSAAAYSGSVARGILQEKEFFNPVDGPRMIHDSGSEDKEDKNDSTDPERN